MDETIYISFVVDSYKDRRRQKRYRKRIRLLRRVVHHRERQKIKHLLNQIVGGDNG